MPKTKPNHAPQKNKARLIGIKNIKYTQQLAEYLRPTVPEVVVVVGGAGVNMQVLLGTTVDNEKLALTVILSNGLPKASIRAEPTAGWAVLLQAADNDGVSIQGGAHVLGLNELTAKADKVSVYGWSAQAYCSMVAIVEDDASCPGFWGMRKALPTAQKGLVDTELPKSGC